MSYNIPLYAQLEESPGEMEALRVGISGAVMQPFASGGCSNATIRRRDTLRVQGRRVPGPDGSRTLAGGGSDDLEALHLAPESGLVNAEFAGRSGAVPPVAL